MQDKLIFKVNLNKLEKFAKILSKHLSKGDCLALHGDLGAGKTTFTSFLVKALGIKEKISSPSFTLVNEYSSDNLIVNHIDAYRLAAQDDLGIEEFLTNSLVIIEWPENVSSFLPKKCLRISFKYLNDEEREISLEVPENYKQLIKELKEEIENY